MNIHNAPVNLNTHSPASGTAETLGPHPSPFTSDVLRTLLYYDIWAYPLTIQELFAFLPRPLESLRSLRDNLACLTAHGFVGFQDGYYAPPGKEAASTLRRRQGERFAGRMWMAARAMTHIIKRFPFVRGVFVSGELSKNAARPGSDIDFFIVTAPERLWIARTLLILFKKTVLFNSKKFFCVNSFVSSDHLVIEERNIYQAVEIAHLKPLYNAPLCAQTVAANAWIRDYFPNFSTAYLPAPRCNNRSSLLQRVLQAGIELLPADRIDRWLQTRMEAVWARRYPQYDDVTRDRLFRCTRSVSRAYAGDFQERVLTLYAEKLRSADFAP